MRASSSQGQRDLKERNSLNACRVNLRKSCRGSCFWLCARPLHMTPIPQVFTESVSISSSNERKERCVSMGRECLARGERCPCEPANTLVLSTCSASRLCVTEHIGKERKSMASLAFAFPLRAGKTEEWRAWIREILGPLRSEYEAFSRELSLGAQCMYLQHTPHGDQAIIYLEREDLQRTFQHLLTAQDPFAVRVRQRAKDLFDGGRLDADRPGIAVPICLCWTQR